MKIGKKKVLIGIVALAILTIPFTLYLNKSSTDNRSKAQIAPTIIPPNIRISSPTSGITVSGKSVTISSEAQNLSEQLNQQYFIDGIPIGPILKNPPYTFNWDSTVIVNGKHILTAQLSHEGQRPVFSDPVTITVNNPSDSVFTAAVGGDDGPTVSAITVDDVEAKVAKITWTTDEPATTQLSYGIGGSSTTTLLDPMLKTNHEVTVTNLQPESEYTYQVKSQDRSGTETTSLAADFTTLAADASTQGQWTGAINWPISAVHATLLYTGEVLIWDAWEAAITKAKLWNPSSQAFRDVPVSTQIFCSGHTMLSDGRILIVGGHLTANAGIKNVTVFDPATNHWTQGVPLQIARWYGGIHRLADDSALVVGGKITPTTFADTPEMYSLKKGTSTLIHGAHTGHTQDEQYPLMFTLPNGKIFATSNQKGSHMLFDLQTQQWTHFNAHTTLFGSAVQYRPGKFLMTGGSHGFGGMSAPDAAIMDMNNPNPVWQKIPSMNSGRYLHNLVMLPDGNVFTAGGIDSVNINSGHGPLTAEIWDPHTNVWSMMAPISKTRLYHNTALLLPDARVLLAGTSATAQIFSPPYLFKGTRPVISSAPTKTQYGANIQLTTPDWSRIEKVSLVSLSSVTHAANFNQYFSELNFTPNSTGLNVQIPTNINIAPPGYYMVFILDTNGVPSVSKIIKLENGPIQPTPTPTPLPTSTPIPTPTPTKVPPTPTQVPPTPTRVPTPTQVPQSTTRIKLQLLLHGIGNGGDSVNAASKHNFDPLRPQRMVTVRVFNVQNNLVSTKQVTVQFNNQTGGFSGEVDLGSEVSSGFYTVKVKIDQFLSATVPGIQNISGGSIFTLPVTILTNGDMNNDNMLSVLDFNHLRNCYSDLSPAISCTSSQKLFADMNDDGFVNQFDYNLFIREITAVKGQ